MCPPCVQSSTAEEAEAEGEGAAHDAEFDTMDVPVDYAPGEEPTPGIPVHAGSGRFISVCYDAVNAFDAVPLFFPVNNAGSAPVRSF